MSSLTDDPGFGPPIDHGGWRVRLAGPADHAAIMALRAAAFRGDPRADDGDPFDADSAHLWVGHRMPDERKPQATVRLRVQQDAAALLSGYAAQSYDLSRLSRAGGAALELGRLCRAAGATADTDVMRLLWAGVARVALRARVRRLIGCTSFPTTDPASLQPGLALLARCHMGPDALRPDRKAPEIYPLAKASGPADAAMLPPLLRVYLAMGGWVSDHLVIDRDLGTSHVFTCVDIDAMPDARKRLLARMAEVSWPQPRQSAPAGSAE